MYQSLATTFILRAEVAEAALSEAQQNAHNWELQWKISDANYSKLQQQLSEAQQELADNLIAFTSMNSMIIKLHDERDSLEISIEGWEQQVAKLDAWGDEAQTTIDTLQQQLSEAQNEISELRARVEDF